MTSLLALKKVSYGTNSLLEQSKETYENDDYDYDLYDDDMYEDVYDFLDDDLPSKYYKDLLYEMYQNQKQLKKHVDYEQLIDVLAMDK
ncbi:hypothetical protein Tco_0744729 [Tanacetum coccineum]